MSNIKELIRAEIERRKKENMYVDPPMSIGKYYEDRALLFFIDTLPDEPITSCNELAEAAMNYIAPIENEDGLNVINFSGRDIKDAFIAGAEWQKRKQPKVKGYGVMRKMEDPRPDDWYMDERGKEHCWGYKFNEPCPWPAEVYIMEAKEDADD